MTQPDEFLVRFWGVRGSVPTPGERTLRYGGNTSCIEVRCGRHLLIFDAGTGARALGAALAPEMPLDADLFLSHTHYDHLIGLPFFNPLHEPGNRFRIWAGNLGADGSIARTLQDFMSVPFFPIPFDTVKADISYRDFRAGETLEPGGGIMIRTAPLNHPDGATGYRVEYGGRAVCYVTDTEHKKDEPDAGILGLIRGADAVIYDSTYTDAEYPQYAGWGHSTWQEGVRLCDAAEAGTLVIFHHDPGHDDAFMDKVAAEAERMRPGTRVAREGMILKPGRA